MLAIFYLVCVPLALLIVALAVGIPYYRTHRRMRAHYEKDEARAYLDAKNRADPGLIPAQPPPPGRKRAVQTTPIGMPRSGEDAAAGR